MFNNNDVKSCLRVKVSNDKVEEDHTLGIRDIDFCKTIFLSRTIMIKFVCRSKRKDNKYFDLFIFL